MNPIVRRPSADRDLVAAYRHDAREAGLLVADRLFAHAEKTLIRLAKQPVTGGLHAAGHPFLGDLRYAPVSSRYKSILIFHLPSTDEIEFVRVLHAARDLDRILTDDLGRDDEPIDG